MNKENKIPKEISEGNLPEGNPPEGNLPEGANGQNADKAEAPVKAKRRFNARSFKHGSMSVVLTVVFVAVVVVLNVIVGLISERFDTAADLTDESIYTLDEKTEKYLGETLAADISITVLRTEKAFEEQDSAYKQVNEILKKMEMTSGHVKVNYLDLDQNPNYTSQFKGETLSANYIVVECEKTGRHRIISPYDYITFNQTALQYYGYYIPESSNIEQEAVSAMLAVSNDEVIKIAVTEGFGEKDSSALQSLLSKNGYEIEKINLMTTEEISSEYEFVIMYAPTIDPDKSQLAKLDKYLDNGGKFGKNVFYFASVNQPETPNIEDFLNDWGLSVGYAQVGQTDANYLISSATLFAHLQQLCDTDYTKNVYGSSLYSLGADLRPVYTTERGSTDKVVLMKTYDKAFLYPMDIGDGEFSLDTAESGTFNDAVAAEKLHTDGTKSRLVVFGSDQLSGSIFMSYNNSNNSDFFINIFNFISGKEEGITIKAKTFSSVTFEMSQQTAGVLAVMLCVVVPVLVIVLGIVIWVRRRHR